MSACTGCDPLVIVKDSHSSIIWFPQIDVRKKAENFLLNYGYSVRQTEDRNELSILVEKSGNFIPRLTKTLSFVEQQATRVLFFEGTKPRLSDFGSIRTLSELKTIHDAQWLTQLIAEKRLFSVALRESVVISATSMSPSPCSHFPFTFCNNAIASLFIHFHQFFALALVRQREKE